MNHTIKQLRQQGYKVRVLHFRYLRDAESFEARGGTTCIELTTPDKAQTVVGKSVCSTEDNFDKKIGNAIALGRALKQLSGDNTINN